MVCLDVHEGGGDEGPREPWYSSSSLTNKEEFQHFNNWHGYTQYLSWLSSCFRRQMEFQKVK